MKLQPMLNLVFGCMILWASCNSPSATPQITQPKVDTKLEKSAIKKVIEAETEAYIHKRTEELISYIYDDPSTTLVYDVFGDDQGKTLTLTHQQVMEGFKNGAGLEGSELLSDVVRSNWDIDVSCDAAWVSFDQSCKFDSKVQDFNESRYMKKQDGKWKIARLVTLRRR